MCHMVCPAGGYPLLEVHAVGEVPGAAGQYGSGEGWMEVGLPGEGKSQGLYQLEVQVGSNTGGGNGGCWQLLNVS